MKYTLKYYYILDVLTTRQRIFTHTHYFFLFTHIYREMLLPRNHASRITKEIIYMEGDRMVSRNVFMNLSKHLSTLVFGDEDAPG